MRLAFRLLTASLICAGCARDSVTPAVRLPLRANLDASASSARLVPGQYFIRFRDEVTDPRGQAQALVATNGGEVRHVFTELFEGVLVSHLSPEAVDHVRQNPLG